MAAACILYALGAGRDHRDRDNMASSTHSRRVACCTSQAPMVNKGAAAAFMGKSVSMPVKIESRTADGFNARTSVCAGAAIACKAITGMPACSHCATLAMRSQDNQTIQVQVGSPEVLVPSWYVVVVAAALLCA